MSGEQGSFLKVKRVDVDCARPCMLLFYISQTTYLFQSHEPHESSHSVCQERRWKFQGRSRPIYTR